MGISERGANLGRSASAAAIYPIAGMVGGLIIGAIRAGVLGLTDLRQLSCVIRWGVTGFFAGLGLVLLLALPLRRGDGITIRWLMALVAVAGLIAWFFGRLLFDAIGPGAF